MEFQVEQNWGDGTLGWIYFQANGNESIDQLKKMAKDEMIKYWKGLNPALYFAGPRPARPTIKVAEYKDGKKVKNGIRFNTKWR